MKYYDLARWLRNLKFLSHEEFDDVVCYRLVFEHVTVNTENQIQEHNDIYQYHNGTCINNE